MISAPRPLPRQRNTLRLPGYDYALAGAYYVTICTHDRQPLLGKITDGLMQLSIYGETALSHCQRLPARFAHLALGAFVIMPNHIHAVVIIRSEDDPEPVRAGLAPARETDQPHNREDVGNRDSGNREGCLYGLPRLGHYRATGNREDFSDPQYPAIGQPHTDQPYTEQPRGLPLPSGNPFSRDDAPGQSVETASLGDIIGAYKSLVANACLAIAKNRGIYLGKFWQRNYYEHIIRDETDLS